MCVESSKHIQTHHREEKHALESNSRPRPHSAVGQNLDSEAFLVECCCSESKASRRQLSHEMQFGLVTAATTTTTTVLFLWVSVYDGREFLSMPSIPSLLNVLVTAVGFACCSPRYGRPKRETRAR